MTIVSATEVQNNFGRYLQSVQNGNEVVILKNGKEAARLVSYDRSVSFLTDSLVGVLKNDQEESESRMRNGFRNEYFD